MKKITLLILTVVITIIPLLGCTQYYIEKTIDDWEKAINNGDDDALDDLSSPDSDFWVTWTAKDLIDIYFSGFTPVHYYNLNTSIDNPYADVFADATYAGVQVTGGVWFVLKKEETLLSFIFPDWKIYRYYDSHDPDTGEWSEPVWRKP